MAAEKKAAKASGGDLVPCYGINKCGGTGSCGGVGPDGKSHSCAGQNACKGQGWLKVPRDVCEKIEGGSLKPIKS
jgi:hypothetical protein